MMTARPATSPDASAECAGASAQEDAHAAAEGHADAAARPPAEANVEAHSWRGRIIDDRYRIVDALAEGGMGQVFVAEHLALRKMVALKTVHPSFLGNEEVAARFAREAMASAQLEHPHGASALDFGRLPDGGAFLVLELVRGPSLREQIEQGPASWKQVCQIGAQIADALVAAHAMGIVHRDLKPDNVLLEARHQGEPFVKVLDFGIARVKADEKDGSKRTPIAGLTKVGAVMGTPGYMAPEQAVGDVVDERADLYALGVILWEMLQGRWLFEGDDPTAIVTQQFLLGRPSEGLAAHPSRIPDELGQLIDGLLKPMRDDRPARATEVRDCLRRLAERDRTGDTERYRIAMPAVFDVTPRLRTVLVTLLEEATPRCRELLHHARGPLRHALDRCALPMRKLRELPFRVQVAAAVVSLLLVVGSAIALARLGHRRVDVSPTRVARVEGSALGSRPQGTPPAAVLESPDSKVQARIEVLSASRDRKQRDEAARWLKAPPPNTEVPAFAKALAKLELGPECRARAEALRELRQLKDPRALPGVVFWNAKPQRGCGVFENRDCYDCIRSDLRATRRALSGGADSRSASR